MGSDKLFAHFQHHCLRFEQERPQNIPIVACACSLVRASTLFRHITRAASRQNRRFCETPVPYRRITQPLINRPFPAASGRICLSRFGASDGCRSFWVNPMPQAVCGAPCERSNRLRLSFNPMMPEIAWPSQHQHRFEPRIFRKPALTVSDVMIVMSLSPLLAAL